MSTLTAASTILGPVDTTVDRLVAAVETRPGTPAYSPAQVREWATETHRRAAEFGIRPSLLAAQMLHETAFLRFGGDVKPQQHNYAGLGATGGVPGLSFPSIAEGVLAVVCHWMAYLYGAAALWPRHLQQYTDRGVRLVYVIRAGYGGSVRVVGDLGRGRWAADPDYAAKILPIANRLITEEQHPMSVPIRVRLIPAGNSNRPGAALQGGKPTFITVHETANLNAGANAEMHRRFTHGAGGWGGGGHPAGWWQGTYYNAPYEGVSFHYAVDDSEAVQLLPDHEIGYHAGDGLGPNSGGATSIAIETCVNQDGDWGKTLANLAWLVRHLMAKHGIPIERVVQHHRWSGKNCPSRLRREGWGALVGAIQAAQVVTPPQPEPPASYDAVTGQYIGEPLFAYWRDNGGVARFGRPLGPMVSYSDGALRQLFERSVLETPAGGGAVEVAGLGQAWLAATGQPYAAWPGARPLV